MTKIFTFETTHAFHGYACTCGDIHSHSYKLYVAVFGGLHNSYLLPLGFTIDFKGIKKLVNRVLVKLLDHKLIVSKSFLIDHRFSPCWKIFWFGR